MVLQWLKARIQLRRARSCLTSEVGVGEALRVDAKVQGDLIAIGGWRAVLDESGRPVPQRSPWFAVKLDQETAPWAFCKGSPERVVATLELLATLVGLVVLDAIPGAASPGAARKGTITLRGWTDSSVAATVVARQATMAFPLCCVNMEIAAQMEARGARLELKWVPRTHNQEADDLTNEKFGAFDEGLRKDVDLTRMN